MTDRLPPLLSRARELMNAGRVIEAIAAYKDLLAAFPDLPDSWFNLAYLQRQARQFDAALQSYQMALAKGVSGAEEVHLNRAAILTDHMARPEEGAVELRRALELKPDYVPALLNLGNLCEDLGQREEARRLYDRALEADPRCMLALARGALLADVSGPGDPLIERVRRAAGDASLKPGERADLLFALGTLLDRCRDYDAAFTAFNAANLAARQALGPRFPGYSGAAASQAMERIRRAFPSASPPSESSGGPGAAPVFICGMFRSGSTLVEQILSRHSRVTAGGELDLIPAIVQSLAAGYPENAAALDDAALARLRASYLQALHRRHPDADLVTDKRPDNFLHIGLIKRLFPDAKIVHTTRDPLDNCLAIHFLHLGPQMPYGFDLEDAGHWYREYEKLMAHWKALWPDDIVDVHYDDLVRDTEGEVRRLLDRLGLGWEEPCLEFHKAANAVKTASAWQVREPIYARSSGRWRNYAGHIGKLRGVLGLSAR
ncbi:tetratricopeptide repeat-containing sulfotransferase family protein [Novosphingobium naphthalenivorans]|uniref:tetratricopeptide repeat-containing sulfotransferase family protein n=1 Tax=Novosphingobium naphthalenivorans TaxID=273168 RepID=UPI000832DC06|nr:sulfotransferase [Novosphingobium naphthalenivorans]